MILLCGIPSETPLQLVTARLDAMEAPYLLFNQRQFENTEIQFEVSASFTGGELRYLGQHFWLAGFYAAFSPLMGRRKLPDLTRRGGGSSARGHCRLLPRPRLRFIAPP